MSTNHPHAHSGGPVEQDAVSFSGISWFVVILVVTTIVCQVIVWGLFEFSEWRVARGETPRATMAEPATSPVIEDGVLTNGTAVSPQPSLLVNEPVNLRRFQDEQRAMQESYGWIDQTMGTIRLPIDRAKDLVIERGLPSRPAPAAATAAAPVAASENPTPTPAPEAAAPQQ